MRERMNDILSRAGLPLAVGTTLGLLGPFGTYAALPLPERLVYWLAVVSFNWLIADALIRRAEAIVPARMPFRRLAVPLGGALAASVPATGIVALAGSLSPLGWPEDLALLLGQVALLMAAIALPVHSWQELREAGAPVPYDAASPGTARAAQPDTNARIAGALFLARLPAPLQGGLLCLEMQDHYMIVHSTGGQQMILCRMEDATRELAGLGLRVHRSWWVAESALVQSRRDGQRRWLHLDGGREVPVGRSYVAGLRAAGWLE